MRKTTTLLCSLALLLYLSISCNKNTIEILQKIDLTEARAWLKENGGILKNEQLLVQGKTMQTATANWGKAKSYTWRGNEYVDVPLQFGNGSIFTSDNETQTPTKFNVVLRRKGNQYEGAIRTTTYNYNVPALEAGRDTSVVLQNYTLLSGQPGNSWLGNTAGQLRAVTLKALSDVEVRQLREKITNKSEGKTKNRSTTSTCFSVPIINYTYYNYSYIDLNDNSIIVVASASSYTSYYTLCLVDNIEYASSEQEGGGAYPNEENMNYVEEDPCQGLSLEDVFSNSIPDESNNLEKVTETIEEKENTIERKIIYKWFFNKATYLNRVWGCLGHFSFIQNKTNNESLWKWQSLKCNGIGTEGSPPPNVEVTYTLIDFTPSISSDKLTASFRVDFREDGKLTCGPVFQTSSKSKFVKQANLKAN